MGRWRAVVIILAARTRSVDKEATALRRLRRSCEQDVLINIISHR